MLLRCLAQIPDAKSNAEMRNFMRVNHNISAQLANVNLKKTNNRLSASLESLSSGYKINKAADDAAGIAISNKMRTQIRALDQASNNADDGQSIIQTAEGSLSEIEALLQRMRELSVQAANDTYIVDDRESIQKEIDELCDEVDRIASTTEFNGNGLLDGSCTRVVTYSENGYSSLALSGDVKAGTYTFELVQKAEPAVGTLNFTIPTEGTSTITINDVNITVSSTDTVDDVRSKVISYCDMLDIDVAGTGASLTLQTRACGSAQSISIQGTDDDTTTVSRGENAKISTVDGFTGGVVCTSDGKNVTIEDNSGFKMQLSVEDTATVGNEVHVVVYDTGSMILQIGANEHQNIAIDFPEVSCRTLQLRESDGTSLVNVCSQGGATKAITTFDDAIRSVSSTRSQLGAYENRLISTVSSLDISSENMTDAMSRIMDTDMATAMTNYTQESVLSQAATTMLAQANNRPQQILSLLQG